MLQPEPVRNAPPAASRAPATALPPGAHGTASLRLKYENGVTRIADLYHAQPLRVLFPRSEPGDVFQAAITCVAGGLVAGDRHEIEMALESGARAMVIGQAAEKIYRSTGADCVIDAGLTVADGAWLEWLPQETILFDAARLRRRTRVAVAPGGRMLAGDILVFGRTARGEKLTSGLVHDAWEIRRDGRPHWKDVLHMDGDLATVIGHSAAFGGARAYGSAIYAAPDAGNYLPLAREIAAQCEKPGLAIGATLVNGLLVTRFLGADALALRNAFAGLWCALRQAAAGLAPVMPRLWTV
jgi:urease accessory protein